MDINVHAPLGYRAYRILEPLIKQADSFRLRLGTNNVRI